MLPRIFFDTNAGTYDDGYILWFDLSKTELAALDPPASDGMAVTIYMPDEIEMIATLRWDVVLENWTARSVEANNRLVGG